MVTPGLEFWPCEHSSSESFYFLVFGSFSCLVNTVQSGKSFFFIIIIKGKKKRNPPSNALTLLCVIWWCSVHSRSYIVRWFISTFWCIYFLSVCLACFTLMISYVSQRDFGRPPANRCELDAFSCVLMCRWKERGQLWNKIARGFPVGRTWIAPFTQKTQCVLRLWCVLTSCVSVY